MALFEIKNLTFKYANSIKPVLNGVDLQIDDGEFVVVCGETGCGKTTLLKLLKKQLQPNGTKKGSILFKQTEVCQLDEKVASGEIAFVAQDIESQIVTDKVYSELSFGLSNLGLKEPEIRRRVAETASFFGIESLYKKNTHELSGGQKQMLNLASVMVMRPKVLILDEPTSQLDPICSTEFLNILKKINTELCVTIVIVEHRLEEVFSLANKVVVLSDGKVSACGNPRNVCKALKAADEKMVCALPSSVRIFNQFDIDCECPISVCEGKKFLTQNFNNAQKSLEKKNNDSQELSQTPVRENTACKPLNKFKDNQSKVAVRFKNTFFRYEKNSQDVLEDFSFTLYENEFLCVLGGNGCGKTTMLKCLCNLLKPYSGKIEVFGNDIRKMKGTQLYRNNVCMLPQNPQNLFLMETVQSEFDELINVLQIEKKQGQQLIDKLVGLFQIKSLLKTHPYDLSGGEKQKVAFIKVLLTNPQIILLDEPTKGLDAHSKKVLASVIMSLKAEGKTILAVTHDVEFAGEFADRCGMIFNGQMVCVEPRVDFFSNNSFYTTACERISYGFFSNAITCEDVVSLCKINGVKE